MTDDDDFVRDGVPLMPPSWDGVYPRCVWCRGENYALVVLAYSRGEVPCAAANGCGRYLPKSYARYYGEFDDEENA